MGAKLNNAIKLWIDVDQQERLKLFLLALTCFFVIGSYTIIKELKDAVFMNIVGREFIPQAKLYSLIILVPAVLFYSKLVDSLRRYQLLYFYSLFYCVVGLICAYLLGDPVIGLANTDAGPGRLFGWVFYFFIEGYSPFVVSVLWAFVNSVSSPVSAKRHYALLIAGSKIGGMLFSGLACGLLTLTDINGSLFFSDVVGHQLLMGISSLMLLCVPFIIYLLMKRVSGRYLHGYEAVYQFEKKRSKQEQKPQGIVEGFGQYVQGLKMFIKQPYILGIFSMIFFYELIMVVFNYQRLTIAQQSTVSISALSCVLYQQKFMMHLIGLIIALIGTRTLLIKLGERLCLLLIPVITGLFLLYFMQSLSPNAVFITFVGLQAINYAFAHPVRESLYIPTVKEIKFKSKSWIDAYGRQLARGSGSGFNIFVEKLGPAVSRSAHSVFFASIVGVWLGAVFLLGKRFARAIRNNEIIGAK